MTQLNVHGQLIGPVVENWTARSLPPRTPLIGRTCRVELVDVGRHSEDLFPAYNAAPDDRDWTYLPSERPTSKAAFATYLAGMAASPDPLHYAVIESGSGKAVGTAAHMRIDPENGVIEVGFIRWSPLMQRHISGTEAIYLLMKRAFDELGYRRYEWKCDNLNERSRAAALRYGFRFEGVFRNAPWSRVAAGTLRGSRSLTTNGPRLKRPSKNGSYHPTSTAKAVSSELLPIFGPESQAG